MLLLWSPQLWTPEWEASAWNFSICLSTRVLPQPLNSNLFSAGSSFRARTATEPSVHLDPTLRQLSTRNFLHTILLPQTIRESRKTWLYFEDCAVHSCYCWGTGLMTKLCAKYEVKIIVHWEEMSKLVCGLPWQHRKVWTLLQNEGWRGSGHNSWQNVKGETPLGGHKTWMHFHLSIENLWNYRILYRNAWSLHTFHFPHFAFFSTDWLQSGLLV